MDDLVVHYGLAGGLSLCQQSGAECRTAIGLVSCRYCQNRIDAFIAAHFDQLFAEAGRPPTIAVWPMPDKEPHPPR